MREDLVNVNIINDIEFCLNAFHFNCTIKKVGVSTISNKKYHILYKLFIMFGVVDKFMDSILHTLLVHPGMVTVKQIMSFCLTDIERGIYASAN